MSTLLPRDDDSAPIPALGLKPGGAHTITITATSTRIATAFLPDTRVIGIYATGPVFLRLGDATTVATATDHYFPADTYYDLSLGGGKRIQRTHIAALRAGSSDCILYVSEKE